MKNENGGCFFLAIILTIMLVIGIMAAIGTLMIKLPALGFLVVLVLYIIVAALSDFEGVAEFGCLLFLFLGALVSGLLMMIVFKACSIPV